MAAEPEGRYGELPAQLPPARRQGSRPRSTQGRSSGGAQRRLGVVAAATVLAAATALAGCTTTGPHPLAGGGASRHGSLPARSAPTGTASEGTAHEGTAGRDEPSDGARLVAAVGRDALALRWAHETIEATLSSLSGGSAERFANDSGPAEGRQVITVGSLQGTVVLLRQAVYVRADAASLAGLFQFPSAAASSLAGVWVELTRSDPEYAAVAAGISLASVMQGAEPAGPVRVGHGVLDGRSVLVLAGRIPAAAQFGRGKQTLYATTGPRPLPLAVVASGSDGIERMSFADVGAASALIPPAHPRPLPPSLGAGTGGVLAVATVPRSGAVRWSGR